MTSRIALPARTRDQRLIAVLRSPRAADWSAVVDTLAIEGIATIELTLTSPSALDDLASLATQFGTDVTLGVGSVTTAKEAQEAIAAGAQYLVTPAVVHDVLDVAVRAGIAVIGGAFTPTEVLTTWRSGAAAVKVFPASAVSPSYLRELRGPFPDVVAMPSGGMTVTQVRPWLQAGAVAVSLGSALIGDALDGDIQGLRQRCRAACQEVESAAGS